MKKTSVDTVGKKPATASYQCQYRKCGKPQCGTCRDGKGHGPYWYTYWREGSHVRSAYLGRNTPKQVLEQERLHAQTPATNLDMA